MNRQIVCLLVLLRDTNRNGSLINSHLRQFAYSSTAGNGAEVFTCVVTCQELAINKEMLYEHME